jgi:hypothetical protein
MVVLRVAAAVLQFRILLREDDVHRADGEQHQLAPGGKALRDRLGDLLASSETRLAGRDGASSTGGYRAASRADWQRPNTDRWRRR